MINLSLYDTETLEVALGLYIKLREIKFTIEDGLIIKIEQELERRKSCLC